MAVDIEKMRKTPGVTDEMIRDMEEQNRKEEKRKKEQESAPTDIGKREEHQRKNKGTVRHANIGEIAEARQQEFNKKVEYEEKTYGRVLDKDGKARTARYSDIARGIKRGDIVEIDGVYKVSSSLDKDEKVKYLDGLSERENKSTPISDELRSRVMGEASVAEESERGKIYASLSRSSEQIERERLKNEMGWEEKKRPTIKEIEDKIDKNNEKKEQTSKDIKKLEKELVKLEKELSKFEKGTNVPQNVKQIEETRNKIFNLNAEIYQKKQNLKLREEKGTSLQQEKKIYHSSYGTYTNEIGEEVPISWAELYDGVDSAAPIYVEKTRHNNAGNLEYYYELSPGEKYIRNAQYGGKRFTEEEKRTIREKSAEGTGGVSVYLTEKAAGSLPYDTENKTLGFFMDETDQITETPVAELAEGVLFGKYIKDEKGIYRLSDAGKKVRGGKEDGTAYTEKEAKEIYLGDIEAQETEVGAKLKKSNQDINIFLREQFTDTSFTSDYMNYKNGSQVRSVKDPEREKLFAELLSMERENDALEEKYKYINAQLYGYEGGTVIYDEDGNVDVEATRERSKERERRSAILQSADVLEGESSLLESPYLEDIYREKEKQNTLDYYEKYSEKEYEDNFVGRVAGNYRIGDIGERIGKSGYRAYEDESDDLGAVEIYQALEKRIKENNEATFIDKGASDYLISTLASYLPQAKNQFIAAAPGYLFGMMMPVVGNVVSSAGSAGYMFRQTAGRTYVDLLQGSGLSTEDARKMAKDSAIVNSAIEFGLEFATNSLFKFGGKGASKVITGSAKKEAVSEMIEGVHDSLVKKLVKSGVSEKGAQIILDTAIKAGKLTLNSIGEGAEEYLQTGVEITTTKLAESGNRASMFEIFCKSMDLSRYTEEELAQMDQAALAGFVIGFGNGGVKDFVFDTAQQKMLEPILKNTNEVDFGKEVMRYTNADSVLEAAIETAKASDKKLQQKLAETVEAYQTAKANGETDAKVPYKEIGNLIKAVMLDGQNVFSSERIGNFAEQSETASKRDVKKQIKSAAKTTQRKIVDEVGIVPREQLAQNTVQFLENQALTKDYLRNIASAVVEANGMRGMRASAATEILTNGLISGKIDSTNEDLVRMMNQASHMLTVSLTSDMQAYKAVYGENERLSKMTDAILNRNVVISKQSLDNTDIQMQKEVASYPYDVRKTIKEYLNYSDEEFKIFIERVLSGNAKTNEKYYFNNVSSRAATDIKELLGIDVQGYKVAIEARMVEHIIKRHGKSGIQDQSLKNIEDIARLGYVLSNYDTVEYGGRSSAYTTIGKNERPHQADTVLYSKKINGTYYVAQAVPDTKAKTLFVVSGFINEKGASQLTSAAETTPMQTSETPFANTPFSSSMIAEGNRIVNGKNSVTTSGNSGIINTNGGMENGHDTSGTMSQNGERFGETQAGKNSGRFSQGDDSTYGDESGEILSDRSGHRKIETRTLEEVCEDATFIQLYETIGSELTEDQANLLSEQYTKDKRLREYDFSAVITYDMLTGKNTELAEIFQDEIARYFLGDSRAENMDSVGRVLSEDMQKRLKNSVVRDAEGHLIPLYHGTDQAYTVLLPGDIGIHFGSRAQAIKRAVDKKISNPIYIDAYLDVRAPLRIDHDYSGWNAGQIVQELAKMGAISEDAPFEFLKMGHMSREETDQWLAEEIQKNGYDGIIYENHYEAGMGTSYIVFSNDQVVRIDEGGNEYVDFGSRSGREESLDSAGETGSVSRETGKVNERRNRGRRALLAQEVKGTGEEYSEDINGREVNAKLHTLSEEQKTPDMKEVEGFLIGKGLSVQWMTQAVVVGKYGKKSRLSGFVHEGIVYLAIEPEAMVNGRSLMEIARHELFHHLAEINPSGYKKFQTAIFNAVFDAGNATELDTIIEEYKEQYDDVYESDNTELLNEEFLADFASEYEVREEFRALVGNSAEVRNAIRTFYGESMDASLGSGYKVTPDRAMTQDEYRAWYTENFGFDEEAFNEAWEDYQRQAKRGAKFAVRTDSNGNTYWQIETDQDIFRGIKNKKQLQKAAYDYILRGKKGEQVHEIINGKPLIFTRISAEEYLYGDAGKKLDANRYFQKMRMAPSILDLIENCSVHYHTPDHKNHKFAKDGFENYRGRVRIDDTMFVYVVRVGQNNSKNMFYDINLEVDPSLPSAKRTSDIRNESTSDDNNVSQSKPVVKTSIRRGEENNAYQRNEQSESDVRFSIEESIFKASDSVVEKFSAQIDSWLSGEMESEEQFRLGDTPAVLRVLGAKKLPMMMSQSVMSKITGEKHNISLEEIKNLPNGVADPIMVFRSESVPNAFIILTELTDKSGNDVVAALHLDKYQKRLKINRIASVYGKEYITNFAQHQIKLGNLKYFEKEKSQEWSTNRGLQLPKLVQSNPDNNIILQKEDVVKYSIRKKAPNNAYQRNEQSESDVRFSIDSEVEQEDTSKKSVMYSVADYRNRGIINREIIENNEQRYVANDLSNGGKRNPAERRRALRKGEMVNEFRNKVNWPRYYEALKSDIYNPDYFDDGEIAIMDLEGQKLILQMQENGEFSVIGMEDNQYATRQNLSLGERRRINGNGSENRERNSSQRMAEERPDDSTGSNLFLGKAGRNSENRDEPGRIRQKRERIGDIASTDSKEGTGNGIEQQNNENMKFLFVEDSLEEGVAPLYDEFINEGDNVQYSTERENEYDQEDYRYLLRLGIRWPADSSFRGRLGEIFGDGRENETSLRAEERAGFATELRNRGQVIERAQIQDIVCDIVKEEAYNDEMREIEAYNKQFGISKTHFFIGPANLVFHKGKASSAFIINGSEIYIRYDHSAVSPRMLNRHELGHRTYRTVRMKKLRNIIRKSIWKTGKNKILQMPRYQFYYNFYQGNVEKVFEEFVCDIIAGMEKYTYLNFPNAVRAFWNGDDAFLDNYKISEYAESTDAGGNTDVVQKNEQSESGARFSIEGNYQSFAEQVSEALHFNKTDRNHIYAGETPSILRQLGLPDLPLLITRGHLRDINHEKVKGITKYHGISENKINKIPYLLNYPVMVFDSISPNNPNAICILTREFDDDGLPIIVVIEPNGIGKYNNVEIRSNFILTFYGRNNPQNFLSLLAEKKENILYINKKRTQELLKTARLQLPAELRTLKFDIIIHKTNVVVNQHETKNNVGKIEEVPFPLVAQRPDRKTVGDNGTSVGITISQRNNDVNSSVFRSSKKDTGNVKFSLATMEEADETARERHERLLELFEKKGAWTAEEAEEARRLQEEETREKVNPFEGNRKPKKSISQQIDEWEEKGKPSRQFFDFGKPSDALISAGVDGKMSIHFDASKLLKILDEHPEINTETIKLVEGLLDNPVIILKSKTQENSLVIFGEVRTEKNEPVMAALRMDVRGGLNSLESVHKIASVYAKRNANNLIQTSEIKYVDPNKKRTTQWFQSFGLQLPSDATTHGSLSDTTISQRNDDVKDSVFRSSKKDTGNVKFSLATMEEADETARERHERLLELFQKKGAWTAEEAEEARRLQEEETRAAMRALEEKANVQEQAERMEDIAGIQIQAPIFFGGETLAKQMVENANSIYDYNRQMTRRMNYLLRRGLANREMQSIARDVAAGIRSEDYVSPALLTNDAFQEMVDWYRVRYGMEDFIGAYRRKAKDEISNMFFGLLENSDEWKDKKLIGSYMTDTVERNLYDVGKGDKNIPLFIQYLVEPMRKNEANRNRWTVSWQKKISEAMQGLSREERVLAQEYGEGLIREEELPTDKKEQILRLERELRAFYDTAFEQINMIAVLHGEKTIGNPTIKLSNEERQALVDYYQKKEVYTDKAGVDTAKLRQVEEILRRRGEEYHGERTVTIPYFPHYTENNDPIQKAMESFGIGMDATRLPTEISGKTQDFKPNRQWQRFFQRRGSNEALGNDPVLGFDMYINSIGKMLFHTDDITKMRWFINELRFKYSDDGIKMQVQDVRSKNLSMAEELRQSGHILGEKESAIDTILELYKKDRTTLSNFVAYLEDYTNVLAGKQSLIDRAVQQLFNRQFTRVERTLSQNVILNTLGGNLSSAVNNLIPLLQSAAEEVADGNAVQIPQALLDVMSRRLQKEDYINRSDFLTNRWSSGYLTKDVVKSINEMLMQPTELVDRLSVLWIHRTRYLANLKKGMGETTAMHEADSFTARIVADRSWGQLPSIFYSKNVFVKVNTIFMVEVNNDLKHMYKDLPRKIGEKGWMWLISVLALGELFRWLFNTLIEKVTGRRPAPSFTEYLINIGEDIADPNVNGMAVIDNALGNSANFIPFTSLLYAMVGIESNERIPIIGNISSLYSDLKDGNWKKVAWTVALFANPLGGSNQLKKMVEGFEVLFNEESRGVSGNMQYITEATPQNVLRVLLFGKSALPESVEWVERGFGDLNQKKLYDAYVESLEMGEDSELNELLFEMEEHGYDPVDELNEVMKKYEKSLEVPEEETTPEETSAVRQKYDKVKGYDISIPEFMRAYHAQKDIHSDTMMDEDGEEVSIKMSGNIKKKEAVEAATSSMSIEQRMALYDALGIKVYSEGDLQKYHAARSAGKNVEPMTDSQTEIYEKAISSGIDGDFCWTVYFATCECQGEKDANGKTKRGTLSKAKKAKINEMARDLTYEQRKILYEFCDVGKTYW